MNIKRIITFSLIFIIYSFTVCYAQQINLSPLSKLDEAGNNFLAIAQKIAYWVTVIMCIMECIKCAFNHNKNGVGQAIITYCMIYGAIFLVPYLMNIIGGIFS